MIKIGLTGNFYSGYDEVADIFENMKVPVFDADIVLKYIINFSGKHMQKIKSELGDDIYSLGLLDTRKFNNNSDFDKLLNIVELDIIKAYEKWRINNYNSFYTIFKSSILFERKLDKSMNFNISVYKPKNIRKDEIWTKTQMPFSTIDNILSNEMNEIGKNEKADYIIHNYSSWKQSVEKQIEHIDKSIMNKKNKNISDRFDSISIEQSVKNMFT